MAAARSSSGADGESTYLPFGWERLWLTDGAAGQGVLSRAYEGGTGGPACRFEQRRANRGVRRRFLSLRPRRDAHRQIKRVHGKAGDAGSPALGSGRGEGPPVPGRMAGKSPPAGNVVRRFPAEPADGPVPFENILRVPGRGKCRSRHGNQPARQTWNGCRGPVRYRPWSNWAGSAKQAMSWPPGIC